VRILSGWRAILHKLRFRASMLKYLARPMAYPLFVLDEARGGVRRTQALGRALALCKVPQLGRHAYPSLTFPRWPSPAFDRMVARGGLNLGAAGTPLKRQVDMAFLSVTRQCAYACRHCYERASLGGEESVPVSCWVEIVAHLQEQGVSVVVLTGGEPMLRLDRVLAILEAGRPDLSDFHLHTSGHGVTPENTRRLAAAGLVAAGVGLDDHDRERHDRLRGHEGAFEEATLALRCFREAGVFTYLNTCLTSDLVRGDGLARHLALARDLGVGTVRYLEPKPCGALFDGGAERLFTEDDRARVEAFVARANLGREHRGDPLVQYEALAERPTARLPHGRPLALLDRRDGQRPSLRVPARHVRQRPARGLSGHLRAHAGPGALPAPERLPDRDAARAARAARGRGRRAPRARGGDRRRLGRALRSRRREGGARSAAEPVITS
jgi:MoaA/NifB/PqqE/SkfB family radical SAM enzyme